MQITAEILFTILRRDIVPAYIQVGTSQLPVTGIRPASHGVAPRERFLYLVSEADAAAFLQNAPALPLCYLILKTAPEHSAAGEDFAEPLPASLKELIRPADTCALLVTDRSVDVIWELLESSILDYNTWMQDMSRDILERVPAERIFAGGMTFLRGEYTVVDSDMNILYRTPPQPGRHGYLTFNPGERLPGEMIDHLLTEKSFLAAATEPRAFLYSDELSGHTVLCHNIFREEQNEYIARILLFADEEERQSPGSILLFEHFAAFLQDMFRYGSQPILHASSDELHLLCRALCQGGGADISEEDFRLTLSRYHWERRHHYLTLKITCYEESGWVSQPASTLSFLARALEQEYPRSCAVICDQAIVWVLNLDRIGLTGSLYEFRQQITVFIREHVCRAGAGPVFSDLRLLAGAVQAADEALRIGQREHPHFWFFEFDHYRLKYMTGRACGSMPLPFLIHPAIQTLREYDRSGDFELSKTLRIYLQSGLNMTAAAKALFIHRTTFCRRMDHIRRLTGLTPEEPDVLLDLLLSYRLLEANDDL